MQFVFHDRQLTFYLQLLFGECIFLYPLPKRKLFFPRLLAVMVLTSLAVAFYSRPSSQNAKVIIDLLFFMGTLLFSALGMWTAFRENFRTVFSMCAAGYAVQHIVFRLHWMLNHSELFPDSDIVKELLFFALCYCAIWLTIGRYSARNECYRDHDWRFSVVSVLIIFICVGLSRSTTIFHETNTFTSSIYAIICCSLALYIQFILHRMSNEERENAAIDTMRREQLKQYEISRNVVESLNIRLHDMKHKPGAPLLDEETRNDLLLYDSSIRTGNEVLDVLLTEKSIRCRLDKIQLSCSGDFSPLSFMKVTDIYSLFGNAIDNAAEAAVKLKNEQKRIIDLSVETRGDLIFIVVTNYFDGNIVLDNLMPVTTKEDEPAIHGYGMKSMAMMAAKYGGELNFHIDDDLFTLNIYLHRVNSVEAK